LARLRQKFRDASPDAARFLGLYYAGVGAEALAERTADELAGAPYSLWRFGEMRKPNKAKVRAFNPSLKDGWESAASVIEIVNDDMPFLVDSVTAALTERGVALLGVIHPIVAVRRDSEGRRLGFALGQAGRPPAQAGAVRESMMHIEIQRLPSARLAMIEGWIEATLGDVRLAVTDWPKMLAKLEEALADLTLNPPPLPPDEIEEGKALLAWMREENFTFLGYREYDYGTEKSRATYRVVPETGLGLLRDPSRRIMRLRGPAQTAADVAPEVLEFLQRPELLIILKANYRSTVHRPVHLDYVALKRFDAKGRPSGERRFVGLFTSSAYSNNPRTIPYLRRKLERVMARSGLDPSSHDGKALQAILDNHPRDDLFQIGEDDLARIALGVLQLQSRPRIKLFARRDKFQRFVSCLIFVPRERYTTALRLKFQDILAKAFYGRISAHYTQIGDEPLARLHVIVGLTPWRVPDTDIDQLEADLVAAGRDWSDDLRDALRRAASEAEADRLCQRYAAAFPVAYREAFAADAAVPDIAAIEKLTAQSPFGLSLYRATDRAGVRLKIFQLGKPIALSDCLPVLENLGLRVIEENTFAVAPPAESRPARFLPAGEDDRAPASGAAPAAVPRPAESWRVFIHDFHLSLCLPPGFDFDSVKPRFEDAFLKVWSGAVDNDGFNRLVLESGLDWREVMLFRAFAKYLRQIGASFSESYMASTLARNADIAKTLAALFHASLDPARRRASPAKKKKGAEREAALLAGIEAALDEVQSLDEDRILRRFLDLVRAIRRTNFYQRDQAGQDRPALALKFDPRLIADMPAPRPFAEVFVYSARVEGVHLRGGPVARGGIRWSDRREDYRTEILGLLKAQTVKNAVIVPVGAKGGFVPKRLPPAAEREAYLAEGTACYKIFIDALLDVTDSISAGKVVPPPLIRRDGDDPYLVVAADKGTATFSDIANALARARDFWLDDAFASGGSSGYDHKKMGITARGAWELVKRHFRDMGVDIQKQDFTVIGVGDMSGDVFGNAMLLTRRIKLIAAFDHRHIFLDPDPDPGSSFNERRRLFALSRSSWADYDRALLSKGGAVIERGAKSVALSAEAKACFGVAADRLTPNELISGLLKAEADLLWLGGIGTFVKASTERQAEVGDRANEAIRANARDLKVKVIGEGANLGVTQLGRIEFARRGGRINTDAIDNSAGVDCSDHEVNIKIALRGALASGRLGLKARDRLLGRMTDEVASLVLRNNYDQGQAIGLMETEGFEALEPLARVMRALEKEGRLDRALEFLPDDAQIEELKKRRAGLTRPELAVLMAYAKISLSAELLASDLPDQPYFAADLKRYFPLPLQRRFAPSILNHRLRREIIATSLANSIVNRAGIGFAHELKERTQASSADVARAYAIARDVFALRDMWAAIEALDNRVPAALQLSLLRRIGDLLRFAAAWFLRDRALLRDMAATVARYRPAIEALGQKLETLLPADLALATKHSADAFVAQGLDRSLAKRLAALGPLQAALDVTASATACRRPVRQAAKAFFALGARLGLDRLRQAALAAPAQTYWERLALLSLIEDLYSQQRAVTDMVLRSSKEEAPRAFRSWSRAHAAALDQIDRLLGEFGAGTPDLARLSVATRRLKAVLAPPR
jgi:glutamate dehydrogenase